MSPLEAARKIAATPPDVETYQGPYACLFCDGTLYSQERIFPVTGHKDDCSWLAMPQIVAALELMQRACNIYYGRTKEANLLGVMPEIEALLWPSEAKG